MLIVTIIENILNSPTATVFDTSRRADGDDPCVRYILKVYDLLRWKLNQIEEAKKPIPGVTRRPYLQSGTIMMNRGIHTNAKKRIGSVPVYLVLKWGLYFLSAWSCA